MSTCDQHDTITVHIEPEIAGLVPGFLANRRSDLSQLAAALEQGDFEAIRGTGHSMKGAGGGYGFDAISDLGAALEKAAVHHDQRAIRSSLDQLRSYLDRVRWCVAAGQPTESASGE